VRWVTDGDWSARYVRGPLEDIAGFSFLGAGGMKRSFGWMFVGLCCAGAAAAAPEQKAGVGPVCLYESKSDSNGAYVCVQKSLMLMCSSDGTRATWKPVGDRDINERCTAPVTLHRGPDQAPRRHWRHAILHRIHPVVDNAAKCFVFVGKQYCE
jgi:hypothetical protein